MSTLVLHNRLTIAYDQYGNTSATPIVLLHGLSSNRTVYNHLARDLADRLDRGEVQLFNLDLRGHGQSSHASVGKYDALSYADDIAEIISDYLLQPAIIIAESLGGIIGVALVQKYPKLVRGLFLEDPPLFLGSAKRFQANNISKEFPEFIKLIDEMQSRKASISEYSAILIDGSEPDELDEADRYIEGIASWDSSTMLDAISGNLWKGCNPLGDISCPLAIVRADPAKDAAFEEQDVKPMQTSHPNASIVMIKGATHSVRATRHKAFMVHLDTFLTSTL